MAYCWEQRNPLVDVLSVCMHTYMYCYVCVYVYRCIHLEIYIMSLMNWFTVLLLNNAKSIMWLSFSLKLKWTVFFWVVTWFIHHFLSGNSCSSWLQMPISVTQTLSVHGLFVCLEAAWNFLSTQTLFHTDCHSTGMLLTPAVSSACFGFENQKQF